jgi:hypothetical protein
MLMGIGLMACVEQHTDYARFCRTAWHHPLHAAVINVADCQMPGIAWDEGDHSMRHRGERPGGQVYPVTLDDLVLRGRPCPQP